MLGNLLQEKHVKRVVRVTSVFHIRHDKQNT